jgi:creatinine amidohydrolase/Fe(II)-dependent formamide hydrolase-like protein
MRGVPALLVVLLMGAAGAIQDPDPRSPRPIAVHPTLFIEEMTWMEVRDALGAGTDTVLIAAGGVEQNGPYVVTGKHDLIVRANAQAIAERLGHALVAPILPFVPEGDFDPPTEHMKYPGTIGLSEDTYRRVLTDLCRSFRAHGFRHIVLIGDHGGDQEGMEKVAEDLNALWKGEKTRVHYIPEYGDFEALGEWVEAQGIKQAPEGLHDDFIMEAQLMAVDPTTVRMKERLAAGKFRINGIDLSPAEKTIDWGRKIIAHRTEVTVAAIRRSMER